MRNKIHNMNNSIRITISIILLIFLIISPSLRINEWKAYAMLSQDKKITNDEIIIESEDVRITVQYGMNQQARYGRNVLISTSVTSRSLSGNYKLSFVFGDSKNENANYSKELQLDTGKTTYTDLKIPMINEVKNLKVALIDASGNTVVEKVNSFNVMNFGPYKLVGILSDLSSDLSYLNAFGSKCYYLDESNFPNDKDGLDILDVIVLNDFDSNRLSTSQFQALKEYVSNGGTLVVGTGKSLYKNMAAFLQNEMVKIQGVSSVEDLNSIQTVTQTIKIANKESFSQLLELISSYENNRINILARLEERSANNSIDSSDIYIGDSMMGDTLLSQLKIQSTKKEIANFTVKNASSILTEEDVVLLQKSVYGKGHILISSFDIGISKKEAENGKIHTSYIELANIIYNNLTSGYQGKLEMESYGSYDGLMNVVNISNNSDLPSIGAFMALLMIYVVLIGPVIYLILKRFDKTKYLWGIVPVLSIGFVMLIYGAGFKTRITNPYIGYLAINRYDTEGKKVAGDLTLRLSFPTNNDSRISVENIKTINIANTNFPPYSLYSTDKSKVKDTYLDMSVYHTGITYLNNKVILETADKPAFSNSFFETTYEYASEPVIDGTISINEQNITGTLANISDQDIEESYVYTNGILITLGELESGESVNIEEYPSEILMSSEMLYYSETLDNLLQYDENKNISPNSNRKVQTIRSVIEELQDEGNASYFISITNQLEQQNPFYELSLNKGSYGTNVLLVPIDVKNEMENQEFVVNMDAYMSIVGGNMQYIPQYRYMLTKSLIVDYYLPSDDIITGIYASPQFNQTIEGKDTSSICENVYFYNNVTNEYDLVFKFNDVEEANSKLKVQKITGNPLGDYLTSHNRIRIKYENGTMADEIAILPYISYYKEIPNANN